MEKSSSVWGFSRGFVYARERVYILAQVPELEAQHVHLTQVLRWTGTWSSFRIEWPCVGVCAINKPEPTLLTMGLYGRIHVAVASGFSEESVDDTADGPASRGVLRDIRLIGEHAYCAGMGRQVYRRERAGIWSRIDSGALADPAEGRIVGFNSIDGFAESDIYAVGWAGEIWRFDGRSWRQCSSPTNLKLERVVCVPPTQVFACGQAGLLLRGYEDQWEVIQQDETIEQFWGMHWFRKKLWLASDNAVYCLQDDHTLSEVRLGEGPITSGWLHGNDETLWSIGGSHLLSTAEGVRWELHRVP